ncbi:DHA2 family efflux MFS transporter permease subunit [Lichenicoccus sp.]|uniref:DHA2 family efflux MFS transporter permease subunit n=1 Tax=Lichenicoccus sp. TaxID=2781899 RepID=UPI003D0BCF52
MSGASAEARNWKPSHNPWLIAVTVTVAAFMEILDTTIVNVSLPHIAGNLASSYDDATWALTAYLAANAIVLTISGWFGRVLGRKRYFMICIGMFTVCSFLCGIASNLPELIVFRLLQGFFGGGLQPNQQSIILDTFPPERRSGAFAITAVATIVAPVLGPTLGGWVTDTYSWRWVFFMNVPVGIGGLIAVAALVEDPPWARKQKASIDVVGLALITIGLGCLQVMMDRGEDDDWFGSPFICILALLAVAGILGAIGWMLTVKNPIVDLRVFADRNFAIGCLLIGGVGFTLYSSAVLVPQFAQQVIGYTALLAGLVLSPGGLGIILLIPFVNYGMKRIQPRYFIAFGFFLLGVALVVSANLTTQVSFYDLVIYRALQAGALGFLFVPISVVAYQTLPKEMNGDGSALFSMMRNVMGAIGISLSTALVTERTQIREAHMAHWMTPFHQPFVAYNNNTRALLERLGRPAGSIGPAVNNQIYQQFREQASVLAYNDAFLTFSLVCFALVPLCWLLAPRKAGG